MPLLSRLLSPRRPRLEHLLERAARHPRHRGEFYRGLLEEEIWVPGRFEEGELYIEPYELSGRSTILIFTSEKRLKESLRSAAGAVAIPGRTLLASLPPFDALVIDYATRLQKEMTPSEVAALLDGSIFGLLRDDPSVERTMLGRPKHYPVALMDALRELLASSDEWTAAYLCQAQEEGAVAPRIVIGLEGEGDIEAIAAFVREREPEVVVMAMGSDGVSEFLRRETEPFFTHPAAQRGLSPR